MRRFSSNVLSESIVNIIHIISGKVWGGTECYVLSLCKRQIKEGHKVEIIATHRPEMTGIFKKLGIKVRTAPLHGHLSAIAPLIIASTLINQKGPVVIHAHKNEDAIIALKTRTLLSSRPDIRVVMTVHLIEQASSHPAVEKVYRNIDAIIFVSNKAEETFLSSHPVIDRKKIKVIHNSVYEDKIPEVADDMNKDGHVRMLYIGRIVPEKGIDTLIEAMTALPATLLMICGTGPDDYISSLKDLAERLGVDKRMKWVGFSHEVEKYIGRAEIGVVPSRWKEPFGLVILEFMSHQIPVVSTNNGAQPEIITDGADGFLVPPDNPGALAAAIRRLSDNPSLRKKMGEAARKTFLDRFTYDKFYRQVMDVYAEVLRN